MPVQPDSVPRSVARATTLLTVVIAFNLISPLFLLLSAGYRLLAAREFHPWPVLAGLFGLAVSLLLLLLVKRVRDGRRWAWIALLVILALYAVGFAAAGIYDLRRGGSFLLLFIAAIWVLMILLLTAPPSSRQYFRRHRAQG